MDVAIAPLRALQPKDFLDHVSLLRGSMVACIASLAGCLRCAPAPSAMALKRASPSGVVGWLVRGGVDPLLIGSILHRVNALRDSAFGTAKPDRVA